VVDGEASERVPAHPRSLTRGSRPARLLLAGYLLLAAGLTVGPLPQERMLYALVGKLDGLGIFSGDIHLRAVEAPSNVLLFVPLGLLLCWGFPRVPAAAVWAVCVLGSIAVEAGQAGFLPGRDPSLLDVLMNGLGAAIGVLLYRALSGRLRPRVPVLTGAAGPR